MSMTDSDRLGKIEALLRKAEDPAATEAEAEAFSAKAQELMTKWAIDEAMLSKEQGGVEEIVTDGRFVPGPYLVAKRDLMSAVVRNNDCRFFFTDGYRTKVHFTVVGHEGDVKRVWLLFESLVRQAEIHLPMTPPGYNGTRFRNSYWQGYALQIGRRLYEQRKATVNAAEEHVPGTALVLKDRKSLVSQYVDDTFDLRRASATPRNVYGAGVQAGRNAADRSDIGNTQVGGARGALGR